MAVSPYGARITKSKGPKVTLMIGSAIVAVGHLITMMMSGVWQVIVASCVVAAGVGFAYGALPALIMEAVPVSETAAANGLNALMRSIGTTVSSAVAGLILAHTTTDFRGVHIPTENGLRAVLALGAGAGVLTFTARVNRSVEAKVHRSYVQDLDTDERYDVIVSGLPLTNLPPAEVERIMARYIDLLHPGGTLTYFAYQGTRAARSLTASRAEARRHAAVDEVMAAYQSRYATGRWAVWANLPPAHVWQLRRPRADDPNDQSSQGQSAR
ncbi:MFS transporter [Streptomyces sp. PSRA5]